MGGRGTGWMEVEAVLRIAYSNQKGGKIYCKIKNGGEKSLVDGWMGLRVDGFKGGWVDGFKGGWVLKQFKD